MDHFLLVNRRIGKGSKTWRGAQEDIQSWLVTTLNRVKTKCRKGPNNFISRVSRRELNRKDSWADFLIKVTRNKTFIPGSPLNKVIDQLDHIFPIVPKGRDPGNPIVIPNIDSKTVPHLAFRKGKDEVSTKEETSPASRGCLPTLAFRRVEVNSFKSTCPKRVMRSLESLWLFSE